MPAPRALCATLALVGCTLGACAPTTPDSGFGGDGFGDYSDYVRQREQGGLPATGPGAPATFSTEAVGAALDASDNGGALGSAPGAPYPSSDAGAPYASPGVSAYGDAAGTAGLGDASQYGRLAGAAPATGAVVGQGQFDPNRPRGDAPANIRQESGEMARSPGLSDDSFQAVSGRETIESDKERLARQRAEYEVIQPTALPQRTGTSEPNIVQFALNTTNLPGTKMYSRSSLFAGGGACKRYASPDLAQEAFLAAGGPQKDGKGLDPDGDGFACGWDPRPFRTALR